MGEEKKKYTKKEINILAERRTNLFINICLSLAGGIFASIIVIYYFGIEKLLGKAIFLFFGVIIVVLGLWFLFVRILKNYFGEKLVLFHKKEK